MFSPVLPEPLHFFATHKWPVSRFLALLFCKSTWLGRLVPPPPPTHSGSYPLPPPGDGLVGGNIPNLRWETWGKFPSPIYQLVSLLHSCSELDTVSSSSVVLVSCGNYRTEVGIFICQYPTYSSAVLRIRDISVRILGIRMRIRNTGKITSFLKHKVIKKSQYGRNQCFSYYFCLMMEGSGAGPVLENNGSGCGSGRPKNIRIRIRNTTLMDPD